jgi:hypothetical protein
VRTIEQAVANESCTADSASFSTPGRNRSTASINISAGNSPPETTKSPTATSSTFSRSNSRSSMPS